MGLLRTLVFLQGFLLLALPAFSDSSRGRGHDKCQCKRKHDKWDDMKLQAAGENYTEFEIGNYTKFGIGWGIHPVDPVLANVLFRNQTQMAYQCGQNSETPACYTEWCYVDPETCAMHWEYGRLAPYSYVTCGNLRNDTELFLLSSMYLSLSEEDNLKVVHLENTLENQYMGSSSCRPMGDQWSCSEGKIASFWRNSLVQLEDKLVSISHKNNESLTSDEHISEFFERFENAHPEEWTDESRADMFDRCAFATGIGVVDLCSAAFALTPLRQKTTYVIELYTAPLFLVSQLKPVQPNACNFNFDEENPRSFFLWWFDVFSLFAWAALIGMMVLMMAATYVVDEWDQKNSPFSDAWKHCSDAWQRCRCCRCCRCRKASEAPTPTSSQETSRCFLTAVQSAVVSICKAIWTASSAFLKCMLFVLGAFYGQSSPKGEARSQSSKALRLGLNFFLVIATTVYAANLTAKLLDSREVEGEITSLEDAKTQNATVCVHKVYKAFMVAQEYDTIATWDNNWEDILSKLENRTCQAALLEEEAWNAFRSRTPPRLCGFYRVPDPLHYMPAGAVVSKRAYKTLESFKFSLYASRALHPQEGVDPPQCPKFADDTCQEETSVPGLAFLSLAIPPVLCAGCVLIVQISKLCGCAPGSRKTGVETEGTRGRFSQLNSETSTTAPSSGTLVHAGSSSV
eukprot:Skav219423  [mRNA]  locus=scaffold571:278934:280988:- [translate_table: standard]